MLANNNTSEMLANNTSEMLANVAYFLRRFNSH